jgi:hypothetical protein
MSTQVGLDTGKLARIGGLCAVAAAVLTVLSAFVISGGGGPGDPTMAAADVVKGAVGHYREIALSASVDAFGVGLFLVFVVILGRLAGPEGALFSRVAVVMTAAFFATDVIWAATQFAFAEASVHISDPNATKTFNLLSQGILLVIAIPIAVQYAAMGLLILRTRVLPALMGWFALFVAAVALVSVVAGIYTVLDPVGFAAFLLSTILWPLLAGGLLIARRPHGLGTRGAPAPTPRTVGADS